MSFGKSALKAPVILLIIVVLIVLQISAESAPDDPVELVEYPIPLPLFLQDIAFVDQDIGWGVGALESNDSSLISIIHTTDGGVSWTEQDTGLADGFLNGVYFTDSLTGYAVGQDWGGDIPTLILYTADGGETWTKAALPRVYGGLDDITFTDDGIGWSVGNDFGEFKSLILRTEDGVNWTAVEHPSREDAGFRSVDFPTDSVGYAVGGIGWEDPKPFLVKTSDSGSTWEELLFPMETGTLLGLYFEDETTGWVVGNSGDLGIVAMTTDGGASWDVATLTGSSIYMKGVAKRNGTLVAVGNVCIDQDCFGNWWYSLDNGKYWMRLGQTERYITKLKKIIGTEIIVACANALEKGGDSALHILEPEVSKRLGELEVPPGLTVVSPTD